MTKATRPRPRPELQDQDQTCKTKTKTAAYKTKTKTSFCWSETGLVIRPRSQTTSLLIRQELISPAGGHPKCRHRLVASIHSCLSRSIDFAVSTVSSGRYDVERVCGTCRHGRHFVTMLTECQRSFTVTPQATL